MDDNKVKIDVEVDDHASAPLDKVKAKGKDLGTEFEAAGQKVKNFGEKLKDTSKQSATLGDELDKSSKKTKEHGQQAKWASGEIDGLARKLLEAKSAVRLFSTEYAKTGDESVLAKLKNARAEFEKFASVARNVEVRGAKGKDSDLFTELFKKSAKAGAEAASTFSSAFEGGLMNAFKSLPPEAQAGIAAGIGAAVVSTGPLIVSIINAALLAGVGAGGLAIGIAMAFQDPRVSQSFNLLGDHIQRDLKSAAEPFKAQLIGAAEDFGGAWTKIKPNIDGLLSTLAPSVRSLSKGAAELAEKLGPSLERAAAPAAKVIDAIAGELPAVGGAIADLLDEVSEHGDSAAEAIKFIIDSVVVLIEMIGILSDTMGGAADGIVAIGQAFGLMDKPELVHTLSAISHGTTEAAGASADYTAEMYNTADAARNLNSQFDEMFNKLMSQKDAHLAAKEGLIQLKKELKENGRTLDENTEKGINNQQAILRQVDLYNREREAAIKAGNGTKEATDQANAAYTQNINGLRRLMTQLDFTEGQINSMIGAMEAIPRQINSNINITTRYRTIGSPTGPTEIGPGLSRYGNSDKWTGGIAGAASGGIRGLTNVGEHGRELALLAPGTASLPPGSQVIPNGTTESILGGMGGGGAGGGRLEVVLRFEGDVDTGAANYIKSLFNGGFIKVRPQWVASR